MAPASNRPSPNSKPEPNSTPESNSKPEPEPEPEPPPPCSPLHPPLPPLPAPPPPPHLHPHPDPHPDPHSVPGQVASWGFFQLLRPILGVLWKADIRPHHALDFASGWAAARRHTRPSDRERLAQAELRVCHVKGEGWRVKLALSPHPHARLKVRERYVYQAGPVGPADAFYDEMQKEISVAAEKVA